MLVLQVCKMAATAPDIFLVFKTGKGTRQRAVQLGLSFFYRRKQKLSQMPPLQLTFTYVLLARTVRSWNPQPQSRLGKQVFLSGARYIAALHATRSLLARRMGVVVGDGKAECCLSGLSSLTTVPSCLHFLLCKKRAVCTYLGRLLGRLNEIICAR